MTQIPKDLITSAKTDTKLESAKEQWKRFLLLLSVATLIPVVLVPLGQNITPRAESIVLLLGIISFLGGTSHVGASAYFYTDREQLGFFSAKPLRYFVIPVVLPIATACAYQYGGVEIRANVLLVYFIWQTYHYQKQNYGIYSFVCVGTNTSRPTFLENVCLELGVFAGILGLIKIMNLGANTLLESHELLVFNAGLYAIFLLPMCILVAVATNSDLRRSRARLSALLLGTFFYAPTFIFSEAQSAILSYALAHGLQYHVFMAYISGSSVNQNPARSIILFVFCLALGGGALTLMADQALWSNWSLGVFGAYLGLVMAHFVLDAGVWRLREKFQGEYIKSRMRFVFSQK